MNLLKGNKCPNAEQVLIVLKLKYKRGTIKLSDINWKVTLENCGRLSAKLSEDIAEEYADDMKRGDIFPMPIVVLTPAGVVVVAGVHRCEGAKRAGFDEIECYIADIELTYQFRLVAVMTNRKEGKRVDKDEGLEYGVELVLHKSLKPDEVCALLGVKESSLRGRLKAHEIRVEATQARSKFAARISDTAIKSVSGLVDNPPVLGAAVDYIYEHKINEADAKDLVKAIKNEKTEAQKLAFLEKEQERRRKEIGPGGERPILTLAIRTRFLRHFHALQAIIHGKKTMGDLQIVEGSDEAKEIAGEWKTFAKTLNGIFSIGGSGRSRKKRTA